jgi:hypothetical protein
MRVFDAIAALPGPLYIVGSCKNAGKTTLLNLLNAELYTRLRTPIGLTTIGRDGEPEDVIWHHPKPPVRLLRGNYFVTTEDEMARLGAAAFQVEMLPFSTPLGRMAIGRAAKEATVEIIGPDTNRQVWTVVERLQKLGCSHQLIDGAFERRTQAASHDGARLALVVSADVAPDPGRIARWFGFQVELFRLPKAPADLSPPPDLPLGLYWRREGMWQDKPAGADAVCAIGPLTDTAADPHLDALRRVPLIVEDATKMFITHPLWRRLKRTSPGVFVMRRLRLVMAASNPLGLLRRFEGRELFDALVKAVPDVPLLDVVANVSHES